MSSNGKATAERVNTVFQFSGMEQPAKSQPLVKANELVNQATVLAAQAKQKAELDVQRMVGMATAFNTFLPTIQAVVGDPNVNLQTLANVIVERDCDIAEDHIEITLEIDD